MDPSYPSASAVHIPHPDDVTSDQNAHHGQVPVVRTSSHVSGWSRTESRSHSSCYSRRIFTSDPARCTIGPNTVILSDTHLIGSRWSRCRSAPQHRCAPIAIVNYSPSSSSSESHIDIANMFPPPSEGDAIIPDASPNSEVPQTTPGMTVRHHPSTPFPVRYVVTAISTGVIDGHHAGHREWASGLLLTYTHLEPEASKMPSAKDRPS